MEEAGRSTSLGGNARALVKGGWGFVSFNDTSGLREKVAMAVSQARLVGTEASNIAETPPVIEVIKAIVNKDPREVPLADKKALMDEYIEVMWSVSPKIQTTRVNYGDAHRVVYFGNSFGSYIEQEKVDITGSFMAMARDGDVVQQGFHSTGSPSDYRGMEGLHGKIREAAERAVRLLSAAPPKGGEYTVVLDPKLAGVFVHEAFGHLSEADFVYENPRLKELLVIGKRFGEKHLNIVDGAAIPGLRGSYQYDDEGTPARTTYLIREGILVGRLHSRETAAKMGEPPSGNARALDYHYPPIVRMTNTGIEQGTATLEDMISDIEEGVYAQQSFGGETRMEMFTFSAGEAYMIRKGKLAEPIRGVLLSGNIFATLADIDAIGNDVEWAQGGGCGKGAQSPLPVGTGSPHIRIRRCVVGGR